MKSVDNEQYKLISGNQRKGNFGEFIYYMSQYNNITTATPHILSHGGHCCGVKHIMGFNRTPTTTSQIHFEHLLECLQYHYFRPEKHKSEEESLIEYKKRVEDVSILIEVILTDNQPQWWTVVEKHGFVEVNSFVNKNSGNLCKVYYKEIKYEG